MTEPTCTTGFFPDFQKLLHALPEALFVLDASGLVRFASPACERLLGFTPQELEGRSIHRFIHPGDLSRVPAFTRVQLNGGSHQWESRMIRKDDGVERVLWSCGCDGDGLLYCMVRSSPGQGEAERRLLKAQQLAGVANYEYDIVRDVYTYTSETLYTLFGLDPAAYPVFTSTLFHQLIHPEDRERVLAEIARYHSPQNSHLEFRIVRPDEKVIYINRFREVVFDAAGRPLRTIGTIQDISGLKRSEQDLQMREERFRSLVQNGNDMFGVLDQEGYYIFCSTNVEQHLGYDCRELEGKHCLDLVHPDDLAEAREALLAITTRQVITLGPFRLLNSRGEWRWLETTASNHLSNPAIGGLVINSRDVTEKKRREDALLESERRFKALVQNGSDLIVVLDEQARFTYLSDNLKAIMGYDPADLLGMHAFAYIHSEDHEQVARELNHVVFDESLARGVQHRFLHRNGTWVWLESRGSNHRANSSIGGILVNSRNIDERVRLHERLNRERNNHQREITAAVIRAQERERSLLGLELHDNVNQVLTTVKLYNEMYVTGYVPDKSLLVKSAEYTQDCINEIRNISRRLSAPTLGKISLSESIGELVCSLNRACKLKIHFTQQLDSGFPITDDLHLAIYRIVQEGLNNILKYSKASEAWVSIRQQPDHLCLLIRDNGVGFDTQARRPGIGITNMKTRAETLNAEFNLRSAPGNGCTIEICFRL